MKNPTACYWPLYLASIFLVFIRLFKLTISPNEKDIIPEDVIPEGGEEFWVGGADRNERKLFQEHTNSKGEVDLIVAN